ncbi:uncharacterized protein LOC142768896 [Rhipicephalus microplus]|uniref:uncharacterized protein LOC142768896 n=1 Tax=Rhipicephalus microplus TaxID=6941 RepID=UPI003F6D6A00
MGNAQGKREQRSGGVSREDDSEIQESNKAATVPVRDEAQSVRLPSAEDDEPGGVDKANHCEPLGTTKPTISSPNTWETMPSPNIHTHGRSEDCQGTKISIIAGNSAELRHHRLNPTGEKTKVPNGILPCSDAAASGQEDSNAEKNANHIFMKERLQADCADEFQGKEASSTHTSESTELRSEAVLSDTNPSIEPTSVMEAETSSSTSRPSPNRNLRRSSGSPSSSPSSARQVPAKKLQKVWGASMLELLTSLAADDVALGADAFRAPEKLDQSPPPTSHYQDNSEDSWRTRCQRILCPPDCAYCQSAITEAIEVLEEDQDASNTPEASPFRPADHSAFRNFNFPSSGEEDAQRQLASKAALVSLAPARMLKPQVLDTCTWKVPLCKRERRRASMTSTSTSPEQTLPPRVILPPCSQVGASSSSASANELQTSNFSEPGASFQVPNAVRQLLQQLGMPSQTAVALLDECPIHMDRGGIPLTPASSRVVRSVLEDPAGTRLLFSNVLQFLAQQAASGRSLLSAERSEEELTNLFKRCSEVREGYQRQLRLLALPCSSEESEHVEPRTLWSPQQVDDVKKEIHSFLQQVQQFSEQAQLFYQQAFIFVTDFKAFQLRVEHLKQAIENVAKTVPQSETLNETQAPRDTQGYRS